MISERSNILSSSLGHQLPQSSKFPFTCSNIELSLTFFGSTLSSFSKFALVCPASESSPASFVYIIRLPPRSSSCSSTFSLTSIDTIAIYYTPSRLSTTYSTLLPIHHCCSSTYSIHLPFYLPLLFVYILYTLAYIYISIIANRSDTSPSHIKYHLSYHGVPHHYEDRCPYQDENVQRHHLQRSSPEP